MSSHSRACRIKAALYQNNLNVDTIEEPDVRSSMSMYAKPVINGGNKKESKKEEEVSTSDMTGSQTGPSQYSLLGNDKYENIELQVLEDPL